MRQKTFLTALLLGLALAIPFALGAGMPPNPVPLIDLPLVPTSVVPGAPAFTLTITGTEFVAASVVQWNGSPRSTTFVSDTELKANILASDVAVAGTGAVTVLNPAPGGGISNTVFLSVTVPTSSSFFSGPNYAAGSTPSQVVVADFRSDGNLDLVVPDSVAGSTVSVLLGNGDGTFQPAIAYTVGSSPQGVVAGDFNNDGKLDLAVINAGTLSVLLGNGDGTFQKQIVTSGVTGFVIAAGDFNSDGKLDIAIASPLPNGTISVLLGNGDGTFQPSVVYSSNAFPEQILVGDFNGDGKLDLAVAGGSIGVLLGNGDGTFQNEIDTAFPGGLFIAAGDFNGDGKLDLAVASDQSSVLVCILLGHGDGTFDCSAFITFPGTARSVVAADLNGDGILDVAVGTTGGFVETLLGNGDGTLRPYSESIGSGNGSGSFFGNPILGIAAGDLNRDGRMDLIAANGVQVTALLQTFASLSPLSVGFGNVPVGTVSSPMTVTLTNSGTTAFNLTSISFTGTNPGEFAQTNNCGTSLPGGTSCSVNVVFSPTVPGDATVTMNVNDTAVGSPQIINVNGFGATPSVSLQPPSLTFGLQLVGTASAFQSAILTNTGSATLTISSITSTTLFFEENNCGATVAPGASCKISVNFRPRAAGIRTGTITVTDNASNSPQTVALTGTGTTVELSSAFVNFGSQPINTTSPPMTVTLTNVGAGALTIFAANINGTHPVFAQTNTCGTSVPAGGSCTFSITFTPTNRRGYVETLQIKDSGGGSPQKVTLIGMGT